MEDEDGARTDATVRLRSTSIRGINMSEWKVEAISGSHRSSPTPSVTSPAAATGEPPPRFIATGTEFTGARQLLSTNQRRNHR